ncbi:hypothetical protein OIU76_000063 [Salix suchowensis]|nr:hypothetical protein OIU76_000063 [Salix suchowensis]KAJ6386615.1 hypothetical protein OIU78_016524 [Salix suchowensis]
MNSLSKSDGGCKTSIKLLSSMPPSRLSCSLQKFKCKQSRRFLFLSCASATSCNSLRDQHPVTSRDCRLHKSHMVSGRDTNSLHQFKFR